MANYRLVASDLDGTLLNKAGIVSEENWTAIETMEKREIYFVPASGRCFSELPAEIRDSEQIRYYILSGGAVIYDKREDHLEMTCPDEETKNRVLDIIYRYPISLIAHTAKVSYADAKEHDAASYASYNMNPYWVQYALEKETPVENFKEFVYSLKEIPMMVIFFKKLSDLEECRALLQKEEDLLVVQSDPYNLEVVSKRAGKGKALLALAKLLGIRREETIAVGDSHNDRTMLEDAGLSLAMENAVPEMRALADEVICDNDSHCAAYILQRYFTRGE